MLAVLEGRIGMNGRGLGGTCRLHDDVDRQLDQHERVVRDDDLARRQRRLSLGFGLANRDRLVRKTGVLECRNAPLHPARVDGGH